MAEGVAEFIREQIPDWDDELKATARFKAFSGQRSDWEPQFHFWRHLIIAIARRFHLLFLSPSQMKNSWFNRGGLTPLCLNDVLLEMSRAGDLIRVTDLGDPSSGRLYQLLKKMIQFSGAFRSTSIDFSNDRLILLVMLEGVKLSLSSAAVSSIPSLDSDILQLVWTIEELQQQLDVVDGQYESSRKSALAALKSGNKNLALRNARQLKISSESRDKLASYMNQVEGVLRVIVDAESTKKVSEAIQIGARAIKENKMDFKEVELCLQELDEFMDSQEQVYKALESASYCDVEEEDIEMELKELELQIRDEHAQISAPKPDGIMAGVRKSLATADSLGDAMSNLKLEDGPQDQSSSTKREHTGLELEAA